MMSKKTSNLMKVLVVGLVSTATIFFLWYQEYTGTVSILTWVSIIGMTLWGAAYSYKRVSLGKLIIFALIAMFIGFLTEFVGSQEGLWSFGAHNPPFYIVTGWVLLALTMLMLTELAYESKLVPAIPPSRYDQYIGAIIPVCLLAFLIGTLGEYRAIAGVLFFSYYIVLAILTTLYYFRFPDTKKLLLALIAAWIVAGFAEFIGASSSLWKFTYGFPVWLIVSGWSLEWLFIFAATTFLTVTKNDVESD